MSLFLNTPLKQSLTNNRIWFKLDNLQASGSFKDRGISKMVKTHVEKGSVSKLVCSSGGNAGHAVATVGQKLGLAVDVFVPTTTMPMMVAKLQHRGANVFVGGDNWNEADAEARKALARCPDAVYIPPFDDPLIWEGNSTIVDELKESLGDSAPDAIIVSVGGGGLLRGIQQGLIRHNWNKVRVFAVETEGAASFAAAKEAGEVVKLAKISTIASSLGALAVVPSVLDPSIQTESVVVSDAEAVQGCLHFAEECRMIVEPACGASLSLVYLEKYRHLTEGMKSVVVVVCGGSAVSLDILMKYRLDYCN